MTGIRLILDSHKRKFHAAHLSLVLSLAIVLFSPLSLAQHEMHNMSAESDTFVMTTPGNDAVLVTAPDSLILHFQSKVQLVKLVLKNPAQGKEIIDIGFRYRPVTDMHYEQPLPILASADYYSAEWAALDGDGILKKGTFHFSFGANAKPPSSYQDHMEHSMQIMSPDYRLQ